MSSPGTVLPTALIATGVGLLVAAVMTGAGSPWPVPVAAALGAWTTFSAAARLRTASARRREAVLAERAARPRYDHAIDDQITIAIAGACCEVWWTTAGTSHAPYCPHSFDQTLKEG
ncbi:hypothetical protein [Streptomyces sp. NPDC005953]|uniref:hypothetical protein n=1 Tax=Streptomyces sp. NPDC005953 TaxID=3156719 RepID=UPI0033DC2844